MDTYVELDVNFPAEVAELKDAVHRFSKNVLRPTANALDRVADPQQVIDRALQMFGGLGVVNGYPVEKLYREIRALRIYEGATEVQKLIIARSMLGDAE